MIRWLTYVGSTNNNNFSYTACMMNSSITNSRISPKIEKELQEREADNESRLAEGVEFTGEDTD